MHVISDSHQCFLLYCDLQCIVKQNTAFWDECSLALISFYCGGSDM